MDEASFLAAYDPRGFDAPLVTVDSVLFIYHEVLIGNSLQKKSFRCRIEQTGLLVDTGEKNAEGRPASLYRLKAASSAFTFVRNLET